MRVLRASGSAERAGQRPGGLLREAQRIFYLTSAVAVAWLLAVVWLGWGWLLNLDTRRVSEETAHVYRQRMSRDLDDSRREAEHLAQQLEFILLLEEGRDRQKALLTAYFTRSDPYELFSASLILDAEGRAIHERGCTALLRQADALLREGVRAEKELYMPASCSDDDKLYAVYAIDLWLGRAGAGRLLAARPLDHAWLYRLADPEHRLLLIYRDKPWASSAGAADLISRAGSPAAFQAAGAFRMIQTTVEIGREAPKLVVAAPYVALLPAGGVAFATAVVSGAIIYVMWLLMGRWIARQTRHVLRLAEASRLFRASFRRRDAHGLLDALSARGDELGQLAGDLDLLMAEAERRQKEERRHAIALAQLDEAVVELDAEGRIVFASAAWKKFALGAGREGEPLAQSLQDDERSVWEELLRSLGNGQKARGDLVLRLAGPNAEAPRWIELRVVPLDLDDGRRFSATARDVTERYLSEQHISFLALHDALTALPNRTLFADRFQQAVAAARRQQTLLGVGLIDLDGFKPINDTYGHAVGDRLLVEVAQRLKSNLRAADTIARLGGDEFALLLADAKNAEEITTAVERLVCAIAQPYELDGKALTVTASVGMTIYPFDEADGDTLLRHADHAMYQAKQRGRNRYHLFNVGEEQLASGKWRMLEMLSAAMRSGQLELHYQPKADMRNGRIIGMEALIRWHHPEEGLLTPNAFLPYAENAPIIVDLGEWAIDAALRQLEDWMQSGDIWPISVNLSPLHFQREDFVPRLQALLARHPRVSAHLLELEIVETSALGNLELACRQIDACRRLGVNFALDDFGTGYSSLNYLRRLRFSTMKVDQSFVRDLLDDEQNRVLLKAIIELARRLGMLVLAEGVETPEHAILLIRLGCELGQGYGIARPMPAAEAARWARAYAGDAEVMRWATEEWSLDDLPLLTAKHDHVQWVERVLLTLEGASLGLREDELSDSHLCRFGGWYYCAGRRKWGNLPEFSAIEPVHDEVHRVGKEIVTLVKAGKIESARAVGRRLVVLRDEIIRLVDELHARMYHGASPQRRDVAPSRPAETTAN